MLLLIQDFRRVEVAQAIERVAALSPTGTRGAGWPPDGPAQQDDRLRPENQRPHGGGPSCAPDKRLGAQTFGEVMRLRVLEGLR